MTTTKTHSTSPISVSPASRTTLLCALALALAGSAGVTQAQEVLQTFQAPTPGQQHLFAEDVASAGDVDGDGFTDLLVGAHWSGFTNSPGWAMVFSGATGALLWTTQGDLPGEGLGKSVASAGDVDGDGLADVIVGAPSGFDAPMFGKQTGYVRVMSPETGATLHKWFGPHQDSQFGKSVASAGDVDGDGVLDVIVGAYRESNCDAQMNCSLSGSAQVLSGATGLLLWKFTGGTNGMTSSGIRFGWDVSGAGDVDNDGFDDVIVGAPWDYTIGNVSGRATVHSGATGAILHTFFGDSAEDQFGTAVSGAGDVNGDGYADLLVGAERDNGDTSGSASVFCGLTGGLLVKLNGDLPGDLFGSAVAGLGDIDGDGFDDFVVAARAANGNGFGNSGLFRVFSGATFTVMFEVRGTSTSEGLGNSVACAGDTNSDGIPDLIAGAGAQYARVFSGPGYCSSDPTQYCTAGTSASGCQATLSTAGSASATAAAGFLLMAAGVEGSKDGLFFLGTGGRQANAWGNGTSFQCVVPPVRRAGLLTGSGTSGQCDGALSQDLNAHWNSKPAQNPGAGAIVQAQLWYRDPQSSSNQNTSLSDAVEFTLCP